MTEWSTEMFLAKFMNNFEEYVDLLGHSNTPDSLNKFLSDFQNNWIHKYVFDRICNSFIIHKALFLNTFPEKKFLRFICKMFVNSLREELSGG